MDVLAIDIGGSSVKSAIVRVARDLPPRIIARHDPHVLQEQKFKEVRETVLRAVSGIVTKQPVVSTVAISTTGGVDEAQVVSRAGHFDGYEQISWKRILAEQYPTIRDVYVANDGRAATWAEFAIHGKRDSPFAHFVVGTGVGGGLVVNGQLISGADSAAGSFGHIKVTTADTVLCSCSRTGCVETVAAADAIVRGYQLMTNQQPNSLISFQEVSERARNGEESACQAFEVAGDWLGLAISNVMNIVNPSAITIGGGVVLAAPSNAQVDHGNRYVEAAAESARARALRRIVERTSILMASNGNDGGMIGAALLAMSAIDPERFAQ